MWYAYRNNFICLLLQLGKTDPNQHCDEAAALTILDEQFLRSVVKKNVDCLIVDIVCAAFWSTLMFSLLRVSTKSKESLLCSIR